MENELPFDLISFNPFASFTEDEFPSAHSEYEKLRTSCSYYMPQNILQAKTTKHGNFPIIHLNIRSLLNKLDKLETLILQTNIDWQVISISETWLTPSLESAFGITSFSSFFCSRSDRRGGGSCIYVKDGLEPLKLNPPQFTTAEVVGVSVESPLHKSLYIIQIYKPPSTDNKIFLKELETLLDWIDSKNKTAYITGDFNFDLFTFNTNADTEYFFYTLCSHGFYPTISKATRISATSSSLLDNIFCNDLNVIKGSGVILTDISDHYPIVTFSESKKPVHQNRNKLTRFDYRKINDLQIFLAEKMAGIETETDPDNIANLMISSYNEGIQKYSYSIPNNRKTQPRKPWISPGILHSINRRHELYVTKIKTGEEEDAKKYTKYHNILTDIIRKAKKHYYEQEFAKHNGDSKNTWKLIHELRNNKMNFDSDPKQLRNIDGTLVENNKDIAETFNSFFSTVGLHLKERISPSTTDPCENVPFIDNSLEIDLTCEDEIINVIQNLKNVGAGYDLINTKIFKATFRSILKYIVHLCNACLTNGIFPSILKIAVVKPIFKTGDSSNPGNYRPISILPLMSKILEKLIHRRLTAHIDRNNIIHHNQFGFQKHLSTYMPIMILQDFVTKAFEDKEHAVGIFLDLRKAFDTVDIQILLAKLQKYGIRNKAYDIISSYLSQRKQCVKIGQCKSDLTDVSIGVPQGSILGPLLFILYINDLPLISNNMTCLSYADDTSLLFKHENPIHLQDIVNRTLNLVSDWFNANFLSLNIDKTFSQHYSPTVSNIHLKIVLSNVLVKEKDEVKYLGLIIDKQLKFNAHIKHVSNIISRNVGIISRIRYFIDKKTTCLLYNSLILPYLNYSCLIWGVNYNSQLTRLTVLQKRAVRLIERVYAPTSSVPLFRKYNLLKISDIARSQMLLVMHRFLINDLPPVFNDLFKRHEPGPHNTRLVPHLEEPFSNRNYRSFTTSCLGPKLWNKIFVNIYKTIPEISQSKAVIKKIVKEHYISQYIL